MIRRALGLGMAVVLLAALPGIAGAAAPEGARLAMVRWRLRPASLDLISTDQSGGASSTLLSSGPSRLPAPFPGDTPSWSADGSLLAFTAVVGTVHQRYSSSPRTKIFVVSADGSSLRPVPGTAGGVAPVFAPDSRSIAFAVQRRRLRPNGHGGSEVAYESEAVWIADLDGTTKRQVTPWHNGLKEVPSSFAPGGSRLAVTRAVGKGPEEALAIGLDHGGTAVLARNALDPVYSPDGVKIAYLRGRRHAARNGRGKITALFTDLFTMRADGTESRQLTNTPKAVEIAPSWDPSGRRLVFMRLGNPFANAGFAGFGDAVMEVNADGSCLTKVLSSPHVMYFGATWQPGPGREAAPVAC